MGKSFDSRINIYTSFNMLTCWYILDNFKENLLLLNYFKNFIDFLLH